jgi:hypothetical protein
MGYEEYERAEMFLLGEEPRDVPPRGGLQTLEEAAEHLNRQAIDLLLLDLNLGGKEMFKDLVFGFFIDEESALAASRNATREAAGPGVPHRGDLARLQQGRGPATPRAGTVERETSAAMKRLWMVVVLLAGCGQQKAKKNMDYVDPFICTLGDHGQLHPVYVLYRNYIHLSCFCGIIIIYFTTF